MLLVSKPKSKTSTYRFALAILSLATAGSVIAEPVVSPDPPPQKVACVGGSMTWGYWLDLVIKRKTYPDHLATLLGPGYQLRNYGFNGATAGRYPNEDIRSYLVSGEQIGTVKWQPDIVVSGLGINDCVPTWHDPERFEQGCRDLVTAWRSSGKNPSIWLWNRLTPDYRGPVGVPAYPGNVFGPAYVYPTDNNGIAPNRPAIQAKLDLLGPSLGVGLIDAYTELSAVPQWAGEGLHFVEPGMKRLAELVYCRAGNDQATRVFPRLTEVAPNPGIGSPSDENGIKSPWVELYNPYQYGIALDGLSLDGGTDSDRFTFANSTVLWPGERRIVFITGNNRNSPIKNLHTNFTVDHADGQVRLLSRNGELIDSIGWRDWTATGSLGRPDIVTTASVRQDTSHLRLLTSTPPEGWQLPSFDPAGWSVGKGGAGSELPTKEEAQFPKRWSADQGQTSTWTLMGGGWSAGQETGTYNAAGTETYLNVPSWITANDASWTAEVKLKLNGSQTGPNKGFLIRGGTRHIGGTSATLFLQSDRVVYGEPYEHGAVLSTEDNTDDFHVFRVAYYAPTRTFFVWRDGIEISARTGGRTRDASRSLWMAMGALPFVGPTNATIDYASYDISGAYAPTAVNQYKITGNHETEPLATDSTESLGPDTTCLMRIPFDGASHAVAGMKLKVEFDDGFRAWLNGVEIASCNAPDSGNTAPLPRDNSRGFTAMSLDVSAFANLVQSAGNVLAVQIFNASDNDGRCFGRASLDLIGPMAETARYFSPPTAGAASGAGSPLPALGWVYPEQPPTSGGSVPLVLELDSDGDGRSNLLEYSQGTNVNQADSAPVIAEGQGSVNFQWRDNPEIGWRLMESGDLVDWRPAMLAGPPDVSPSGTSGMLQISQPVSGTGKSYRLAAVEQPTLSNWQQRYFTTGEIAAGDLTQNDADPDEDSLPNFVEYAIASNPRLPDFNLIHGVAHERSIAFPDPGGDRGASWNVRSSPDLSEWHPVAVPDLKCFVDPVSGRYELKAGDPELPQEQGFLRVGYSPSGL